MTQTICYRDRRTGERFTKSDSDPHFTVFHYAENSMRDDGNRSLDIYGDAPEKRVAFSWTINVIVIEAILRDGRVIYSDPGCARDLNGSIEDMEAARYQAGVVAVSMLVSSFGYSDFDIGESIAQIRHAIELLENCPRYAGEMKHFRNALKLALVLSRDDGPSEFTLKRVRTTERLFTNLMCRIEGKAEDSVCRCQDLCDC